MDRNYDVITFYSKNAFILRRPRATISADIIKSATMFIKKLLEDSES